MTDKTVVAFRLGVETGAKYHDELAAIAWREQQGGLARSHERSARDIRETGEKVETALRQMIESQEPAEGVEGVEELEPVMMLRGRSIGAGEAIRYYADQLEAVNAPADDVAKIREQAGRMERWPKSYPLGATDEA